MALFAPGLPSAVEQIILRAMAKDPAASLPARGRDGRGPARRARGALPAQSAHADADPAACGRDSRRVCLASGSPNRTGHRRSPGTCLRCGAANSPQHHFCTSCGYDLLDRRAAVDTSGLQDGRVPRCRISFAMDRSRGGRCAASGHDHAGPHEWQRPAAIPMALSRGFMRAYLLV